MNPQDQKLAQILRQLELEQAHDPRSFHSMWIAARAEGQPNSTVSWFPRLAAAAVLCAVAGFAWWAMPPKSKEPTQSGVQEIVQIDFTGIQEAIAECFTEPSMVLISPTSGLLAPTFELINAAESDSST